MPASTVCSPTRRDAAELEAVAARRRSRGAVVDGRTASGHLRGAAGEGAQRQHEDRHPGNECRARLRVDQRSATAAERRHEAGDPYDISAAGTRRPPQRRRSVLKEF
jgi:hypothetical protein